MTTYQIHLVEKYSSQKTIIDNSKTIRIDLRDSPSSTNSLFLNLGGQKAIVWCILHS